MYGQNGGPRAISNPRPHVKKLAKLLVNFLQVNTSSFSFFIQKHLKKEVILNPSAALRTNVMQAVDFQTIPQNISFPG
jgi:hypothetical protein